MPREAVNPPDGRVRAYTVNELTQALARLDGLSSWDAGRKLPFGWQDPKQWRKNDILKEWGAIFVNLLLRKGLNYGIGGMYIEFENVASPGDPVDVPVFTRGPGEGIDYYNDLSGSSTRDYLRIPIIAGTLSSSDETEFPLGNVSTFFAQTSGVAGVHGKGWSDAYNSVAYGGALVTFVDDDDFTRDIVLARAYFEPGDQQAKLPTSQVGYEWEHVYG